MTKPTVSKHWRKRTDGRTDRLTDRRICRSIYSACKVSFAARCKKQSVIRKFKTMTWTFGRMTHTRVETSNHEHVPIYEVPANKHLEHRVRRGVLVCNVTGMCRLFVILFRYGYWVMFCHCMTLCKVASSCVNVHVRSFFCLGCFTVCFMFSVFLSSSLCWFSVLLSNVCLDCIWASLPEIKRWNGMEWLCVNDLSLIC